MQVSEDGLRALTAEDNDSSASEDGRMPVPGGRRRSGDPWLDPAGGVNVEDVRIVQIGEARLLAFIIMTAKDNQGRTGESGRVSTAGRRRHTFDLRESPEPFALNY